MPWGVFLCHDDRAKQTYCVKMKREAAEQIKEEIDSQGKWLSFNPKGELALAQVRVEQVPWRHVKLRNPFQRN